MQTLSRMRLHGGWGDDDDDNDSNNNGDDDDDGLNNRDFKIQRRGRQRERQKNNRFN